MRNSLLAVLAATSLIGACKWTDFDDLEDTTWVRSTQDPEIGSSDYPVAIAGVSTGTSGGTLAVISDDISKYSLIAYTAEGGDSVNTAQAVSLGGQQIGAVSDTPVFVTDPAGRIALVERSSNGGGNFAVFFGAATSPAGLEFAATTQPAPAPDAAVFVPNGANFDLVFAAGNSIYTLAAAGGTPVSCMGMDNNNMPLQVAALDHDGTNLWVWTKTGSAIRSLHSRRVTAATCLRPARRRSRQRVASCRAPVRARMSSAASRFCRVARPAARPVRSSS